MKTIVRKPYFFFFGLVPFFILIAFLFYNANINFIFSNVFFSIDVKYYCFIAAFFAGIIGLNYSTLKWIKKQPSKILTLLHLILQTSAIILFVIFITNSIPNNIVEKMIPVKINYNMVLSNALFLFLCSIIIHMINFFQCLLLKSNK